MKLFEEFLNVIFPHVCGFCEQIDKNGLCKDCEKTISKMLIYKRQGYKDKFFDEHIYILDYENIRGKILEYKFNNKSYLYKTFAKIILNSKKICDILKSYDIITSVPIHKKRKKERGYNQSELIAREISKNIDEICYKDVLKKIKNNPKQSLLNEEERVFNVKNVYEVLDKEIIYNKRIILFDDIYTTGNTVNECSRVLKQNGAKYILVLSLAK